MASNQKMVKDIIGFWGYPNPNIVTQVKSEYQNKENAP